MFVRSEFVELGSKHSLQMPPLGLDRHKLPVGRYCALTHINLVLIEEEVNSRESSLVTNKFANL